MLRKLAACRRPNQLDLALQELGWTSKRIDKYIRSLLTAGAVAVVRHAQPAMGSGFARCYRPKEVFEQSASQPPAPSACEGEEEVMASGRAADREDPKKSKRKAARSLDRDPIRGLHQGQRSDAPHQRAGHMTAPDHFAEAKLSILRRRGLSATSGQIAGAPRGVRGASPLALSRNMSIRVSMPCPSTCRQRGS
jgi:hypothetical protein